MIKKILINILLVIILLLGCNRPPSISTLPSLDSFQQQENRIITAKMDILWVIDNSESMEDNQQHLRENFNSFITDFIKKGYDYRIAVTTTDAYYTDPQTESILYNLEEITPYMDYIAINRNEDPSYLTSKFVDGDLIKNCKQLLSSNNNNSTIDCRQVSEEHILSGYHLIDSSDDTIDFKLYDDPLNNTVYEIGHADYIPNNVKNIFAINSNVGITGVPYESGLNSIQTALNTPANKEFNFPRPDAHLAIIVVSDEEDQIEGNLQNGSQELPAVINNVPVINYHDFLTKLVSPIYGYSFHTIARLDDNTCRDDLYGGPGDDGIGTRYIKLSDLSGGVKASICGDFSESLSNIAKTIIEKTVEFSLTRIPEDSNKLQVSVKSPGKIVPTILPQNINNGWTYIPSKNSIVFHGTSIPAQGSEINVLYDPDGL